MKTFNNIIYYSINTKLAFLINENYYQQHFVWCAPVFDSEKLDHLNILRQIPPSSNPFTIYKRFKQDVTCKDLHSNYVTQNKTGLKKGAIQMLNKGVIDLIDFSRITTLIDKATIDDFMPFIYLIPKGLIESKVKMVDVDFSANPLSVEFQIEDLKKDEFEIIEF